MKTKLFGLLAVLASTNVMAFDAHVAAGNVIAQEWGGGSNPASAAIIAAKEVTKRLRNQDGKATVIIVANYNSCTEKTSEEHGAKISELIKKRDTYSEGKDRENLNNYINYLSALYEYRKVYECDLNQVWLPNENTTGSTLID